MPKHVKAKPIRPRQHVVADTADRAQKIRLTLRQEIDASIKKRLEEGAKPRSGRNAKRNRARRRR